MRRKVNFYIDGFNFYHRLRDMLDSALGLDYRWLDYRALCQSLLKPGEVLGDVFFFPAIPRHFLASETKNLLVLSLLRRHACLTTPVVKPCSRNGSQSNRKRIPQTKTSSCRLS